MSARTFLWRWNRRIIRREWRQYALIFALIAIATTLSTAAMLLAHNITEPPGSEGFGNASLVGTTTEPALVEQALIDQGHTYGTIASGNVIVPGAIAPVAVKVTDPHNEVVEPLFDLIDGRWPTIDGEVAVTDMVPVDGAAVGQTIELEDRLVDVVGLFEDPTDLRQEFILATDLDAFNISKSDQTVEFLVDAAEEDVAFPPGVGINGRNRENFLSVRTLATIMVSIISAIALLEVALVSSAGFAVMARRRSRQYGLLAAAGATPRHIRASAAIIGTILGLTASLCGVIIGTGFGALAMGAARDTVNHRVDFTVPWWAVGSTLAFAVLVATLAARWPARKMSKQPVVAMLASMRVRPEPVGRSVVAGVLLTAIGAFAVVYGTSLLNPLLVMVGVVLGPLGLLLMAPLLVKQIGRLAKRMSLPARMGGRATSRYNRRSGAMVAALGLALGIPAALSTTLASSDQHEAAKPPNMQPNVAALWLPGVRGGDISVPADYVDNGLSAETGQLVSDTAAALPGMKFAPIEVVISAVAVPQREVFDRIGATEGYITTTAVRAGTEADCGGSCHTFGFGDVDADGESIIYLGAPAWVATPALLESLGVDGTFSDSSTMAMVADDETLVFAGGGVDVPLPDPKALLFTDGIDATTVADLMLLNAAAAGQALINPDWVATQAGDRIATVGWLMVSPEPIPQETRDQINDLVGSDLVPEFNRPVGSQSIANRALLVGLITGLVITIAAVTLLNGERARDNQILHSIGAPKATTRKTSAAVAGFLAFAGAVIGVAIGYLALLPQLVNPMGEYFVVVPWIAMGVLLILFPLLAAGVGWLSSSTNHQNLARLQ